MKPDGGVTAEQDTSGRLRALIDAGISLSSELSLETVLQKLVGTAAELTDARYAALGVLSPDGSELDQLVTTGMSADVRAEIGALPRGRGILGLLIKDARPLRLHDLAEHPHSVGFPPGHPPMKSFLGVPVTLRGVAYGNLYLTEKRGGADFTQGDEEIVTLLASQAAVSIENARLYESATRWLRQIETLNEVTLAMLEDVELPHLLALVARRLRELINARIVLISMPRPDGSLRIEAADGEGTGVMIGRVRDAANSKTGRVFSRRRSERVDSMLEDPEVDREAFAQLVECTGAHPRTALYAPLMLRDRAVGIISAYDRLDSDPRFLDVDQRLAETLADRAASAVDLSQRVARDSLRRFVEGQEAERGHLARELHDETGQALTSILLSLRSIEESGAADLPVRLAAVRELVTSCLQDVRRLAISLRPTALDDFGVSSALRRLCEDMSERSGVRVDFQAADLDGRLPRDVESCLYRVAQEALTNVVKHAGARHVSVLLTRTVARVALVVEDDGSGFALQSVPHDRFGLVGMRERVGLVGGALIIESSARRGTTLRVDIPLTT
ncbi:MAG: sensor histidine kinase [Gaiellales bacterium]